MTQWKYSIEQLKAVSLFSFTIAMHSGPKINLIVYHSSYCYSKIFCTSWRNQTLVQFPPNISGCIMLNLWDQRSRGKYLIILVNVNKIASDYIPHIMLFSALRQPLMVAEWESRNAEGCGELPEATQVKSLLKTKHMETSLEPGL